MQERKIELDTLISLAEKEKDYDSIFHYLTMLLNTKDYNKILSVINKNKDGLAKFDQIGLMDIHFYALLQLERFVDAMDEIRYYEDLPYVSQEVEEHVKDLRNIVKGYEEETKIINKFKNKKAILAVDNDPAGDECRKRNPDMSTLIPCGKDWNDDLRKMISS